MEIIPDAEIPASAWQSFIAQEDRFSHDLRWREVIARAYGLRPCYLAARDGGELVGALPLFRLPGLGVPAQLISLPFLNPGGVAASSPQVRSALEQAALDLAGRVGARSVVLRSQDSQPQTQEVGYCLMRRDLPGDEQALWASLRSEERGCTRKCWRSGVQIRRDRELLPVFIRLYQEAMLRFGTPPHSTRWFRALVEAFGQEVEILVAYLEGVPIAAELVVFWEEGCHPLWLIARPGYRRHCPANGLTWEVMRLALAKGKTRFHFGRSIYGGGTFALKLHYGGVPYPLRYERLGRDGSREQLSPLGSGSASRLWRRLPLGLSNALGPLLRRRALPGLGARSL